MFSAELSNAAIELCTFFCKRKIVRVERKNIVLNVSSSVKAYSMLAVNADKDSKKSKLMRIRAKRVKISLSAEVSEYVRGCREEN